MLGATRDPLLTTDRPLARFGFFRRTLPLGTVAVVGLTTLLLAGYETRPQLLAAASIGLCCIWAFAWITPWERLPAWSEILPPLLLLALFVGVRSRLDGRLPAVSLASLFLIPMFWMALFGTPRQLWVFLAAVAAARVGAAMRLGERPDLAHALVAVLISSTICILTNQVVQRLRGMEASLRALVDRLPVGFVMVRAEEIVYANERLARSLGYEARELIGREASSLLHPDHLKEMQQRRASVLAGETTSPVDHRFLHRDGGEVIQETTPMALRVGGEPMIGVIVRDVSDERMLASAEALARQRMATERARLVAILGAVRDGVAILDHERRGIYANPAYLELFGLDERRLVGMSRDAFIEHVATLADEPAELSRRISSLAPNDESTFVFARPRRRIMRRTIRPLELPDGPGYLVVWHDVTADHDLVAEREQQAMTDPLTGLPNRRGGELAIQREIARAKRQGSPLAFALLDIDRFKAINDRFGHETGDRVLASVGGVLLAQARITDTVVRWGGEEFLAVLPGDDTGAVAFCERVRAALSTSPIGDVGCVTISGGVSVLEGADDAIAALRRADGFLYDAKRAGRDRIVSRADAAATPPSPA